MKIAIDISPLKTEHKNRGIGVYTKNLIQALKEVDTTNEYVIASNASELKADIIHYPYFTLFKNTLPISTSKCKVVITIHDVIPLLYPNQYKPGIRGKFNFFLQTRLLNKASAIITDSQCSKRDIHRYLHQPLNQIHVVYPAASKNFKTISENEKKQIKNKYQLPDRFVLYVGDANFNKNIPALIKAVHNTNYPLVLVGKKFDQLKNNKFTNVPINGIKDLWRRILKKSHPELAHFKKISSLLNEASNIVYLDFLSEIELAAVYNLSTVYCQPSLYEGFGLPILEAMACGTPVVCSNSSSLPEVAGDAALYFDPTDTEDMTKKIQIAYSYSGKKLEDTRQKVKRQAAKFSWQKTAKDIIKIYQTIAM